MNNDPKEIKALVRDRYGAIAQSSGQGCCGPTNCCGDDAGIDVSPAEYAQLDGYVPSADLGLGCGLPTQFAQLKPGEIVIDLGAGAGNDVFVARRKVGEAGQVIGVDMTPAMIARAEANKLVMGYQNVEFRLGEIEDLPVDDDCADVILSNCVLNLVPDKAKAFAEMHRVLKSGGRFSISDIVVDGELPTGIRSAAAMYIGCVAGAMQKAEYLSLLAKTGFANVTVHTESVIDLPTEVLSQHMSEAEIESYRNSGVQIYSITVTGRKQ